MSSQDRVTFCTECEREIRKDEDPEGYQKDLCPDHRKALLEERSNRDESDDIYSDEAKEKLEEDFNKKSKYDWLRDFEVPQRQAKAAIKYYLDRPQSLDQHLEYIPYDEYSLYLHGPTGSGKTVLAAALLYHYAYMVATGRIWKVNRIFDPNGYLFVNVPDTLLRIRQSYGKKGEEEFESKLIDRMKSGSLIVIDDLGVDKTTDWVLSTLYVIINHRYSNFKPTIFTSNLDLDQLAKRLDDHRISSRIDEWCVVKPRDEDLR